MHVQKPLAISQYFLVAIVVVIIILIAFTFHTPSKNEHNNYPLSCMHEHEMRGLKGFLIFLRFLRENGRGYQIENRAVNYQWKWFWPFVDYYYWGSWSLEPKWRLNTGIFFKQSTQGDDRHLAQLLCNFHGRISWKKIRHSTTFKCNSNWREGRIQEGKLCQDTKTQKNLYYYHSVSRSAQCYLH